MAMFRISFINFRLGSGLSSSSAFVCCSAVATHHVHQTTENKLNKGGIVEASIKGEQFSGVRTGGMDQSISIMAPRDAALLIDFYPKLCATAIYFPKMNPAPVFVIANTMIVADKHSTAPTNYNLRVIETRFAAAIMIKKLKGNCPCEIVNLRQVQELFAESLEGNENAAAKLCKRKLPELADIEQLALALEYAKKEFKKEPYTLEEVAQILEISVQKLNSLFVGSIIINAPKGFKLYQRTMHVFSEAKRVLQFRDICLAKSSKLTIKKLGSLMNESHESCRDFFDCSCSELDELRTIAL